MDDTKNQSDTLTPRRIGYRRLAPYGRQSPQLVEEHLDVIYEDVANDIVARPKLAALIAAARPGDTVIVQGLDVLAQDLRSLCLVVEKLIALGVAIHAIDEALTFSNEPKGPIDTLRKLGEFDRACRRERHAAGVAKAKLRGGYRGKRLSDDLILEIQRRVAAGQSRKRIARELKIARQSVYTYAPRIPLGPLGAEVIPLQTKAAVDTPTNTPGD